MLYSCLWKNVDEEDKKVIFIYAFYLVIQPSTYSIKFYKKITNNYTSNYINVKILIVLTPTAFIKKKKHFLINKYLTYPTCVFRFFFTFYLYLNYSTFYFINWKQLPSLLWNCVLRNHKKIKKIDWKYFNAVQVKANEIYCERSMRHRCPVHVILILCIN